jgi:hypothetical protein
MKVDTSKSTVLVISMGFLLIYLIFSWYWSVILSFAVGALGISSNHVSNKIEWIWMRMAHLLSYIIPNILLGMIFYLLLFPISLLYRLFNKDPLMLASIHKSYFIDVKKTVEKGNFEKTW